MYERTNNDNVDYNTINRKVLEKLAVHKLAPTYHYSEYMGSACWLDAPGFPTYFLHQVYTQYGSSPSRGATQVLYDSWNKVFRALPPDDFSGDYFEKRHAFFRKLWLPLSMESVRFQAWERAVYSHMRHGYRAPWLEHGKPIDFCTSNMRFYTVEQNMQLLILWDELTMPTNSSACRYIRTFYPDYTPNEKYLKNIPTPDETDWWNVHASQPLLEVK